MKTCNKCNQEKMIAEFNKNLAFKDGLNGTCKDCMKVLRRIKVENGPKIEKIDKVCSRCFILKPIGDFPRDKYQVDGYNGCCKECTRDKNKKATIKRKESGKVYTRILTDDQKARKAEYSKKYHAENKEKLNAYSKKYRSENVTHRSDESKEKNKAYQNELYRSDPDYRSKILMKASERRKANPDMGSRQYHENKEYYKEKHNEWVKNHPVKAGDITNKAKKIRREKIRNGPERCNLTIMQAKYKQQDGKCFYCNQNIDFPSEKEHIVPLAKGGDDRQSNVVISCRDCNCKKHEYILHEEWNPSSISVVPSYSYIQELLLLLMNDLNDIGIECRISQRNKLLFDGSDFIIEAISLFWDTDRFKMKQIILMENTLYVYEDELLRNRKAIINTIKHVLGKSDTTYARKCSIKHDYDYGLSRQFLEDNHLHGFSSTNSYRIGLVDEHDNLVALLMAGKNGMTKGLKEHEYEISRICVMGNVPGGVSKLFSAFVEKYNPTKIITYSDPVKRAGSVYESLGFKISSTPVPLIIYANNGERIGSRAITNRIENGTMLFVDKEIGEYRNAKSNGYYRVFYPGIVKYTWTSKEL